jgi:hypothetical protein
VEESGEALICTAGAWSYEWQRAVVSFARLKAEAEKRSSSEQTLKPHRFRSRNAGETRQETDGRDPLPAATAGIER